jgi:hypothetical protein
MASAIFSLKLPGVHSNEKKVMWYERDLKERKEVTGITLFFLQSLGVVVLSSFF